jgi:hypothetical protein
MLWERLWSVSQQVPRTVEGYEVDRWVGLAINHPAGELAEALLSRLWSLELRIGSGIPRCRKGVRRSPGAGGGPRRGAMDKEGLSIYRQLWAQDNAHKLPAVLAAFAELVLKTGEEFPKAISATKKFLMPIDNILYFPTGYVKTVCLLLKRFPTPYLSYFT